MSTATEVQTTAPVHSQATAPVILTLETWEWERANDVGGRRFTANWGKANAKHYDPSKMEDDRTATVAAAIAELAVAKYTNRYWHASIWHRTDHKSKRDLPDVGSNIEVKRVRHDNGPAAVRKSQLGKGMVLWVARPLPPEFIRVELYGWLPYDEAWLRGTPASYDDGNDTQRIVRRDRLWTALPPTVTQHKDGSISPAYF